MIFTAGPRITPTPSAWHSSPSVSPILVISSLLKLAAVPQPAGKHTALMLSFIPR